MIQKIAKPPATQRRFTSPWTELEYLCKKTHYWLHKRKEPVRAGRYRDRLERVLRRLPKNELAILRYEGWALLCELKGETSKSIENRKREIELIERLHREASLPRYEESTRKYMLRGRELPALRERQAILKSMEQHAIVSRNGHYAGK